MVYLHFCYIAQDSWSAGTTRHWTSVRVEPLPNNNKKPTLKQLTAGIQKGKEHTTVKNEQMFIFNPLRTPKTNEHILLVTVTSEGVTQHGCWGDPDSLLA